jgi:glycerophosphoryl diester phosphodiesterase
VDSQAFNISSKRLTVAMVERCHRQMIPVAVYTVNEPEEMRRVMGMGVDAIFTDYPDQMLEIVAELQGPPP